MTEKNNKTTIALLCFIIIGLLAVIIIIIGLSAVVIQQKGKSPVDELPADVVAENMINYIKENFSDDGTEVSLLGVSDEGTVYKVSLNFGGRDFDSFASKDGRFLFPEGIDLKEIPEEPQTDPVDDSPDLSDVDPKELTEFVSCLKDAGFVIYGANWCGWTTRLVDTFGGQEFVGPIYVECTEKTELCEEKEVRGYPTILVNDESYQGDRTFDGFSKATGCLAPAGSPKQETVSQTGGC